MALSIVSNSKLRKLYGVPTIRGLLLFGILGAALWFSISRNSAVERWLFLLMIFLVLVQLLEVSRPLWMAQFRPLAFDPPFAGKSATIPIQIYNSTNIRIEKLHLKLGKYEWIEHGPIPGNSTIVAFQPFTFSDPGRQQLPALRVRYIPTPKFFRFWKVFRLKEMTFVLPRPLDHQVLARPHSHIRADDELSDIEQIRDPAIYLLPIRSFF